jgi:hypothetical protein
MIRPLPLATASDAKTREARTTAIVLLGTEASTGRSVPERLIAGEQLDVEADASKFPSGARVE